MGLMELLFVIGPAVVYWLSSGILTAVLYDDSLECVVFTELEEENEDGTGDDDAIVSALKKQSLRVQAPGNESRNFRPALHVISMVLTQHVVMIIVQFLFVMWQGGLPKGRPLTEEGWLVKGLRLAVAMVYMDSHNYWLHRLMHENR